MNKLDKKEFDIPQTILSRDIDSRVIQLIVLQCLGKIKGVGLTEGTLIGSFLGRENDRIKGIHVDQDPKSHSLKVRLEMNIAYGIRIPEKAEEVQARLIEEITHLTGLHVAAIHVVIKGLLLDKTPAQEDKGEESLLLSIEDLADMEKGDLSNNEYTSI